MTTLGILEKSIAQSGADTVVRSTIRELPMSFSILDGHPAIGWDFDNTLIAHDKSPLIHSYIRAHPEKRHVIVTFRSFGWQHTVWEALSNYPNAPAKEAFEALINIDDARFFPAAPQFGDHIEVARLNDAIRVVNNQVLITDIQKYVEWKGETCWRRGLTVLVDDKPEHVIAGCDKYGVLHIHPDDL